VTVRICTTASLRNSTCPAHGDGASADGRDQSDRVTREPKSPPNNRDVDSSHASCIGRGSAGEGGHETKAIPHLSQNRSKLYSAPVAICPHPANSVCSVSADLTCRQTSEFIRATSLRKWWRQKDSSLRPPATTAPGAAAAR
jgi:hypothetical protein